MPATRDPPPWLPLPKRLTVPDRRTPLQPMGINFLGFSSGRCYRLKDFGVKHQIDAAESKEINSPDSITVS